MKKIVYIVCFLLIVCVLGISCASGRRAQNCPAYGNTSGGYERLPY